MKKMRVGVGLLGMVMLSNVWGCSAVDDGAVNEASADTLHTSTIQGAISVSGWPSLPLCTLLSRGGVYFVKAESKLVYCDGKEYRSLDFDGKPGKDGVSWVVMTMNAGSACPYGGAIVVTGPDANGDKVIDTVTSSKAICNGAPGAKGDTGAKGDMGDSGAKGDPGADGKDAANGAGGHDGQNGAAGKNTAVRLTPFGSSATCATGGIRFEAGLDANGNGTLEDGEVSSSAELCNAIPVDAGTPPADPPPPPPEPDTTCMVPGNGAPPGVLNDTGQGAEGADFCNIQFPIASMTVAAGVASELIIGRIFEPGLTDTQSGVAGPGILMELGYGPLSSDPRTSAAWSFRPATFKGNPIWDINVEEYVGTLRICTPGTYAFAYRVSFDNGANFTYCDRHPTGDRGYGNQFSTNEMGEITVQ